MIERESKPEQGCFPERKRQCRADETEACGDLTLFPLMVLRAAIVPTKSKGTVQG